MSQQQTIANLCASLRHHITRNDLVAYHYSEKSPCSSSPEQQSDLPGAAHIVPCATTDDEFSCMSLFRSPFILYTATVQIPENVHIASVLQSVIKLGLTLD